MEPRKIVDASWSNIPIVLTLLSLLYPAHIIYSYPSLESSQTSIPVYYLYSFIFSFLVVLVIFPLYKFLLFTYHKSLVPIYYSVFIFLTAISIVFTFTMHESFAGITLSCLITLSLYYFCFHDYLVFSSHLISDSIETLKELNIDLFNPFLKNLSLAFFSNIAFISSLCISSSFLSDKTARSNHLVGVFAYLISAFSSIYTVNVLNAVAYTYGAAVLHLSLNEEKDIEVIKLQMERMVKMSGRKWNSITNEK